MEASTIRKLYYSISEVSRITSVRKHILRSWEAEFGELHPDKNRAGNRIYRLKDIKTIFLIKRLLFEEKYTVDGAKIKLRTLKQNHDTQLKLSLDDLKRIDTFFEVRRELRELLDYLSNQQEN
ncbi:MAG: MerR family transcriptional regulator, partial [bacterium]